jgi:hypothetical protein
MYASSKNGKHGDVNGTICVPSPFRLAVERLSQEKNGALY